MNIIEINHVIKEFENKKALQTQMQYGKIWHAWDQDTVQSS